MCAFHKILFVSLGSHDETEALRQALTHARNDRSTIDAVIFCPNLPGDLVDFQVNFEEGLRLQLDELSIHLLSLSRALADTCSGELKILSCWDFEFEEYLRGSVWVKVPEEELQRTLENTQAKHRASLNQVIERSAI